MPCVLRSVEGEHARTDDLPGREARILDGERGRITHDLKREVASRHEPAVERRQPRDGLAGPKTRKQRVRVRLELLDRRGGPDRKQLFAGGTHRARGPYAARSFSRQSGSSSLSAWIRSASGGCVLNSAARPSSAKGSTVYSGSVAGLARNCSSSLACSRRSSASASPWGVSQTRAAARSAPALGAERAGRAPRPTRPVRGRTAACARASRRCGSARSGSRRSRPRSSARSRRGGRCARARARGRRRARRGERRRGDPG